MDFKGLGLKCGIEIHQQLNTKSKLFCGCSANFSEEKPVKTVARRLRFVAGETGEVDAAAMHEFLKGREFRYRVYENESCLVELDEEPPHPLNRDALETALQIALMLNCDIPDEIEVMRKTVIDGSNTSGFQRTCIVGLNGFLDTSLGRVKISNVCLEEESCQIIEKEGSSAVYGLNRLGIPLVEIGTGIMENPEQAKETAEKLGLILRSTGRVRRGLGTIRQDLNVSVERGARVEIKGVQRLNMIPKLIGVEAARQLDIIKQKKTVSSDVRKALDDGTTEYMRPMPGSARLYPETDIPPVRIEKTFLAKLRKHLPEKIEETVGKLLKCGLNEELANQLMHSDRLEWFNELVRNGIEPNFAANTLLSVVIQLRRDGVNTGNLGIEKIRDVLVFVKNRRITKDAVPAVLKAAAERPGEKIENIIKSVSDGGVPAEKAEEFVRNIVEKNKHVFGLPNPQQAFMGLVMKELKGSVPGSVVSEILKKVMERGKK
jgi:Glu-tRNA(Gln) amidotransferase subunit E-like FAD-binding protein